MSFRYGVGIRVGTSKLLDWDLETSIHELSLSHALLITTVCEPFYFIRKFIILFTVPLQSANLSLSDFLSHDATADFVLLSEERITRVEGNNHDLVI